MTEDPFWTELIQNIRDEKPVDLDSLVAPGPARRHRSFAFPRPVADQVPASTKLWTLTEAEQAFVGVRVLQPIADTAAIALRLAAAAVERRIIPVILTTLPVSGFERFGFRTERMYGATADDLSACEAGLARFWNFAIVIDAEDVALLG